MFDEKNDSKRKVKRKESLTLNDKDFIIKHGRLMMVKELNEDDFFAPEINIEFSEKMSSEIVKLQVKQTMQSEAGIVTPGTPISPFPGGEYAISHIEYLQPWEKYAISHVENLKDFNKHIKKVKFNI